jgi:hypothetical protein
MLWVTEHTAVSAYAHSAKSSVQVGEALDRVGKGLLVNLGILGAEAPPTSA